MGENNKTNTTLFNISIKYIYR